MMYRILLLIVILPFIASGAVLFDGSWTGTEVWTGVNDPFGNWTYSCIPSAGHVAVIPATDRTSYYMAEFVVAPGDDCNADGGASHSMVQYHNAADGIGTGTYDDVWYSNSVRLDETYPQETDVWSIHTAMSTYHYYDHPPGELRLGFMSNSDITNWHYYEYINEDMDTTIEHWPKLLDPMQVGVWYDFKWHIKWSTSTDGFIDVWVKRQGDTGYTHLTNISGISTKRNDPSWPNDYMLMKTGIYRAGGSSQDYIIGIMNSKIATTEAEVNFSDDPGVPTPPPYTLAPTTQPTTTYNALSWTPVVVTSPSWEDSWMALPWVYIACFGLIGYGFYSIFKEMI